MPVHQKQFGTIDAEDGRKNVKLFTISNENIELQVMNYGATIVSLKIPDMMNKMDDIVLGFDTISSYLAHPHYFGCTVGRVANRIANGTFVLNNTKYNLAVNNGNHHLHGGIKALDKVLWQSVVEDNKVIFSYTSPSGEESYPGDLKCDVAFELVRPNELVIDYKATTSEATPISLTNHSYFNLSGHGSGKIYDHIISLNADHYTPVDDGLIPTGEIKPVVSTNFDIREPKRIGDILDTVPSGIDHNFCVNGEPTHENKVASIHDPKSGRSAELFSTQPGVQLYTANFLPDGNTLSGKEGKFYSKHGALCLETQNYPNAINQPNFPKAVLDVGEVYHHRTRFVFNVKR